MADGLRLLPVKWIGRALTVCLALMLGCTTFTPPAAQAAGVMPHSQVFLNKWALQIRGGKHIAQLIADQHGFRNLGQIGTLEDYYLFEHHAVVKRSTNPSRHHHTRLRHEPKVLWVEQQVVKKRVKRDYTTQDGWSPHLKDPLWPKMWYLHGDAHGGFDMKVMEVWKKGYTGKGIVVTILDDGIEHTHSDLTDNYDPLASLDINGGDKDPLPRYDSMDENKHGTRCAGEVAATGNNTKCAVGVAYHAGIGGVRMLDGDVSDFVEAEALSLNPQHVDIYSASWGPDDNGKVVDGPGKLAKNALISGVLKGRGGRGSIYVWASGNGGSQADSCSCDGYTNSIFTLSVSSASEKGTKPWYLEECPSTLAATYSSGENYHEKKIITTDLHDRCTERHTGTSASAPLAAGMVALTLEANPSLTWRDMQYIVIQTARTVPLQDGGWTTNGVGRKVSHRYGYGLMDGAEMVGLAERWVTAPPQHICLSEVIKIDKSLDSKRLTLELDTDGCAGSGSQINYLEHVQAKVTLTYSRRGDLQIHLTSPNKTTSTLLPKRKNDYQPGDFKDWPFMSVFYWGEQPAGTWTLEIENTGLSRNTGILISWQLILYGAKEYPIRVKELTPPPGYSNPPVASSAHGEDAAQTGTNKGATPSDKEDKDDMYIDYTMEGSQKVSNPYGDAWPEEEGEGAEQQEGQGNGVKQEAEREQMILPEFECDELCDASAGCVGPSPQDCLACSYARLGHDGPCVESCPPDRFLSEPSAVCIQCPAPCITCQLTPQHLKCLSCIQGYYFIQSKGLCVTECPLGTRAGELGTCEACEDRCIRCKDGAATCGLCEEGYDVYNGKCVIQCAPGQYRDKNGRCEPCHQTCWTCLGPQSRQCLDCLPNTVYHNGSCVSHCPQGHYHDYAEHECRRCHPSCHDCTGPAPDECTTCIESLMLRDSICKEDCYKGELVEESGRYELLIFSQYDDGSGECQSCDSSCENCHGPGPAHCLACRTGMFLEFGHCVYRCQDGYFDYEALDDHDHITRECRQCHHTCKGCSGGAAAECDSCQQHLFFSYGECKAQCGKNEYTEGRLCQACHTSCETCQGPTTHNCTTCSNYSLYFGGQCLDECPDGYFGTMQQCHQCHHSCSICIGDASNQCLSCKAGYSLTEKGMCMEEEERGPQCDEPQQYYSQLEQQCQHCDASCQSCNGPGKYSCLACTPPWAYYEQRHQCLPCCHSVDNTVDCCVCNSAGLCVGYHHSASSLSPSSSSPSNGNHPSLAPSHSPNHISSSSPFHPKTLVAAATVPPSGAEGLSPTPTPYDHLQVAVSAAGAASSQVVGLVVCLCVFSMLLFFVVFGLLQLRSGDWVCRKQHKYQPVPTLYSNGVNKVKLMREDYDDEDDDEVKIYSSA